MGIVAWLKEKCGSFTSCIDLPREEVARIIRSHNAEEWFLYAFEKRAERWHACSPSFWIARNLPKDAVILETGCGSALNLIWLGQRGFSRLHGIDINREALAAGRELAQLAGIQIRLEEGDCTRPGATTGSVDVLLALSWTYLVASFDLETFLRSYRDRIRPGGYLVLDVIDASYHQVPNNAYLTSDWELPEPQRRPSEYRVRYSPEQVASALEQNGFRIVQTFSEEQTVPVVVYIAKKAEGPSI